SAQSAKKIADVSGIPVDQLNDAKKRAQDSQNTGNWAAAREALEELAAETQVIAEVNQQMEDVVKRITGLPQKKDRAVDAGKNQDALRKFKTGDIPGGLADLVTCLALIDGFEKRPDPTEPKDVPEDDKVNVDLTPGQPWIKAGGTQVFLSQEMI